MFITTLIAYRKKKEKNYQYPCNYLSFFLSLFWFRELQDQSNRVDVISVTSLRPVTACDAQRSTTPRLLKVGLTEDVFLINLCQQCTVAINLESQEIICFL